MPIGKSSQWNDTPTTLLVQRQNKPTPFRSELMDQFHTNTPILNAITLPKTVLDKDEPPYPPTQEMVKLATKLRALTDEIQLQDITTPRSSAGTSVIVAMLLERIERSIETPNGVLLRNVALSLLTTSPVILLEYWSDTNKIDTLIREMRERPEALPNFIETELCPILIPAAYPEFDVTKRIQDLDITKGEYVKLMKPFVQCFYPGFLHRVTKILGNIPAKTIHRMVTEPGYFAQYMKSEVKDFVFDPPRWVTFPEMVAIVKVTQDDTDSEDTARTVIDGFSPLTHLGITNDEASGLLFEDLKTRALQTLPPILQHLLTPEETTKLVVDIATTSSQTQLCDLLSETGFRTHLNRVRGVVETTPTPPSYLFRIRVHAARGGHVWESHEHIAHTWVREMAALLSSLGFTLGFIRNPLDDRESPIDVNSTLTTADFSGYCHPKAFEKTVSTLDIWCISPCEFLGKQKASFPFTGDAVDTYFSMLSFYNMSVECRESRPFGIFPCAALTYSDRRDNDDYLRDTYSAMLSDYFSPSEVPSFHIHWMSLYSADMSRSISVKCVMSLPEDISGVQTAFGKLVSGTKSDRFAPLHLIDICVLTRDDWDKKFDLIYNSQQNFQMQFTRVVLTGLNGRDPFFTKVYWDDTDTECTVAHHIFRGSFRDNAGIDIPIVKLTADATNERYYLYSRNQDASALIRYGRTLKPILSEGLNIPEGKIRLQTFEAVDTLRRDQATTIPTVSTTPVLTAQEDTVASASPHNDIPMDIREMVISMHSMMIEYGKELGTIKSQITQSPTAPTEIHSTVQSSITSTVTQLQDSVHSTAEKFAMKLADRFESFAETLGAICLELSRSQNDSSTILHELIAKYDVTAMDCYDGNVAYGTELAMLRLMVHACVERINLLLAELRPNWNGVVHPSPQEVDAVLTKIHDEYHSGVDMCNSSSYPPDNTDTATPTNPESPTLGKHDIATESLSSFPTTLPGLEDNIPDTHPKASEGRQRTPQCLDVYPPFPRSDPPTLPASAQLHAPLTPTRSVTSPAKDDDPSTDLAKGHADTSTASTTTGDETQTLSPGAVNTPQELISQCPRCKTNAVLIECETCSEWYCQDCTRTVLDIGLIWCVQCSEDTKPQTVKRGGPLSTSGSDTSPSHSENISDGDDDDGSDYTQYSTGRSGRRRRTKRSTPKISPRDTSTNSQASANTHSEQEPVQARTKQKVQSTLASHGRPRRTLAKYTK